MGRYKVGDIVKSIAPVEMEFILCNQDLICGIVEQVNQENDKMIRIRVLDHLNQEYIGKLSSNINERYFVLTELSMIGKATLANIEHINVESFTEKNKISFKNVPVGRVVFKKELPIGYVKDFKDNTIKIEDSVYINSKFYLKNIDSFNIDGIWYTKDDERLIKDYEGNLSVKDKCNRIAILENDELKLIFLNKKSKSKHNYKNYEHTTFYVTDEKNYMFTINDVNVLKYFIDNDYHEQYGTNNFVLNVKNPNNRLYSDYHSFKLSKKIKNVIQDDFENGTDSNNFLITEGLKYTFGVEMETNKGMLNPIITEYKKLNLSCVRDGSVRGGEYVTGVLKGTHGFMQLNKICADLSKRCSVDKSCGVHVHVGGFHNNKEFTIFSYLLGIRLQEQILRMFPVSRRNNNYCKLIPQNFVELPKDLFSLSKENYDATISNTYEKLFAKLTRGSNLSRDCNKLTPHPSGRYAGGRDEMNPRYFWLNLIPSNFIRENNNPEHRVNILPLNVNADFRFYENIPDFDIVTGEGLNIEPRLLNVTNPQYLHHNINYNSLRDIDAYLLRCEPHILTLNVVNNLLNDTSIRMLNSLAIIMMRHGNRFYKKAYEYMVLINPNINRLNIKSFLELCLRNIQLQPIPKIKVVKKVYNNYTVEFRCHSGSLNYTKIQNWVKFCMAYVSFVENHKEAILTGYLPSGQPLNIFSLIDTIYPKTGNKLKEYIQYREDFFNKAPVDSELEEYSERENRTKRILKIKEVICV